MFRTYAYGQTFLAPTIALSNSNFSSRQRAKTHSHEVTVGRHDEDELGHSALRTLLTEAGDVHLNDSPPICHHNSFLL